MPERVLRLRNVALSRGSRQVLDGVDLEVARGELVAIMGPSGVGKTTLLRVVAGLEPFGRGEVDVDGVHLAPGGLPRHAVRRALVRKVGMVFQLPSLFEHLDALHNVWLAPVHVQRAGRAEAEARARRLLDQLGVAHRARALPRELSGGEAQRVAIARALAVDPPVLLMDEPTASLDPARRGELAQTLRALVAGGRTLVLTTHDDDFASACATRVAIVSEGRIVEQGPPGVVLASPQHPATRALLNHPG